MHMNQMRYPGLRLRNFLIFAGQVFAKNSCSDNVHPMGGLIVSVPDNLGGNWA